MDNRFFIFLILLSLAAFASMPCIILFGFAINGHLIFGLKNQQKMNVVKQLTTLQERICNEGADSAAQKLISLMTSLKVNCFFKFMYYSNFQNLPVGAGNLTKL